jgi:hypothetical protein
MLIAAKCLRDLSAFAKLAIHYLMSTSLEQILMLLVAFSFVIVVCPPVDLEGTLVCRVIDH